jgi:exopolyphosphatase/guanosine-5'-triphosphate,3'-diphosphate pyrophosphatase
MRRVAAEALEEASARIPSGAAATLVGVAGTTTTVQALALGLERYDPDAIHRSVLTRSAAASAARRLGAMTTAERRALPVMAPGREDVIVAGCELLLEIMDRWGFDACLVSERDILDGLAMSLVASGGGR